MRSFTLILRIQAFYNCVAFSLVEIQSKVDADDKYDYYFSTMEKEDSVKTVELRLPKKGKVVVRVPPDLAEKIYSEDDSWKKKNSQRTTTAEKSKE